MDASDEIIGLYRRHATAWDSRRGRTLFERPWLDRFLARLPTGGSILDLGCGGGDPMAGYVLDRGFAVTGIDTSPPLLDLARRRFAAGEWIAADMRGLDLGRRFDGILAWDSFFHLDHDDQRAMFEVFRRHAAPGAALMFTSGPSHGIAMGTFEGEPLYHASLAPGEYRKMLRTAGFAVVDFRAEDPECGRHTVWLASAPAA
jgi:SAM-dependent methyltransferase